MPWNCAPENVSDLNKRGLGLFSALSLRVLWDKNSSFSSPKDHILIGENDSKYSLKVTPDTSGVNGGGGGRV